MRLSAFILTLCIPTTALALDPVREGLWEISVQAEIGGQPISSTPLVVRQCITSQTAQELMGQLSGSAGGCQVTDLRDEGSRARWNLSCSGQVNVSGSGEVMVANNAFTGTMSLLVQMNGQTVPMLQSFNARRVGDCK